MSGRWNAVAENLKMFENLSKKWVIMKVTVTTGSGDLKRKAQQTGSRKSQTELD